MLNMQAMSIEDMVNRRIGNRSAEPLVMYKETLRDGENWWDVIYSYKEIKAPSKRMSLQKLVEFLIKMAGSCQTRYVKSRKYQCHTGASRSAFDIWRCVKYYRPDVTLFQVMNCMARLPEDNYSRSYCTVVRKRVFHYTSYGAYHGDDIQKDEFGLVYSDWASIGKSK